MNAAISWQEVDAVAQARTFSTVAGALLFYANQRRKRMRTGPALEGSMPRNEEQIEADAEAYARIVGCLTARAPEDWDERYELREEAIAHLIAYYDSTTDADNSSLEAIAHRLDMTLPKFLDYVRKTRNAIRRRMTARGVLPS